MTDMADPVLKQQYTEMLAQHREIDIGDFGFYGIDLPHLMQKHTHGAPRSDAKVDLLIHPDFSEFKPVLTAALTHAWALGETQQRRPRGRAFTDRTISINIGRPSGDVSVEHTTRLSTESVDHENTAFYLVVGTKDRQVEGFYHEACHLAEVLWFKSREETLAEMEHQTWDGNPYTASEQKVQSHPFINEDLSFGAWREWYSEYFENPAERFVSECFQTGLYQGRVSLRQAQFVSHDLLGNYACELYNFSRVKTLPDHLRSQLTKNRMVKGLTQIWHRESHELTMKYLRNELNSRNLAGIRF